MMVIACDCHRLFEVALLLGFFLDVCSSEPFEWR